MTRKLITAALFLTACAPAPPVIEGVTLKMNPNESAPLAGVLEYSADQAVRPRFTLSSEGEADIVISDAPAAQSGPTPLLGMRPEREYKVSVSFEPAAGGAAADGGTFTLSTPALPDDFPPIEVTTLRPTRMEPGYHFIPVMRWTERGPDREFGLVLALDSAGEVVWYYRSDRTVNDVKRLSNGDLIYLAGRDGRMMQINKLGELVKHWHTTGIPKDDVPEGSVPVDCDTFHHDFVLMEDGKFLALSSEAREYEDYPTSETDPEAPRATATVIGDVVVEFDQDGTISRRWDLLDVLDPYRISHSSLGTGFWKRIYEDVLEEPGKDWAHANSLVYDSSDDSVIISMNHQSAIMKMRLKDSSVAWIHGDHGGWGEPWSEHLLEPVGDLIWTSKQHAAELTPTGTVLIFDNGGHRGPPFAPDQPREEKYSRAVEFKIDEETMTTEEVWSYGSLDTDHFFSSFLCDVDLQPTTGNVIVTDGARIRHEDGGMGDGPGSGHHWAHIFEVDRTSGRKVFELQMEGTDGWAVYRSERFNTLY